MKKTKLLAVILIFLSSSALFALGKSDKKREIKDKEWVLCISDFDASLLPQSQRATVGYVEKELTKHLSGLDYKLRDADEYHYYWTAAWLGEQSAAAKKLAEKQKQRDELLYKPLSNWNYKAQLKTIDAEIEKLREQLEEAELKSPDIATIPAFNATADNINGIFPAPPEKNKEYSFCKDQKANGFLKGKASLYHERILVEVELWTVWSRSYSYKDSIIFSIEDIDMALNEFVVRLINSISGMEYSVIVVRAEPDNAVIVIDDQFAGGIGKTEEIQRTPGPVEITAYAADYIPVTTTVDLNEGERADVSFSLTHIPQEAFHIDTKSGEEATVYRGALFVGTTPLTLIGPLGGEEQVGVLTADNRSSHTVFEINDNSHIRLDPVTPPDNDRIEKARRGFYNAFGRFWVGLPICTMLWGMSQSYIGTYNLNPTVSQLDTANKWVNVQPAVLIVGGILAVDIIVRFIIYVYQGNKPGTIFSPKETPAADAATPPAPVTPLSQSPPAPN
jgi:hypothetical protein